MKLINKIFAFAVIVACLASCGLDNWDPPKYTIKGTIVNSTDKKPVQVQGSRDKTQIRVHEYGWNAVGNFNATVGQDGTFSMLVFKGTYHLIPALNRGPWVTVTAADTIHVDVNGDTEIEIPVKAFALLDAGSFTLNGNQLTATANVMVYDASSPVEHARLFVSWTSFVDVESKNQESGNFAPVISGTTGTVSTNMVLSDQMMKLANERGLYARIGIKIQNRSDWAYTPPFKLK